MEALLNISIQDLQNVSFVHFVDSYKRKIYNLIEQAKTDQNSTVKLLLKFSEEYFMPNARWDLLMEWSQNLI